MYILYIAFSYYTGELTKKLFSMVSPELFDQMLSKFEIQLNEKASLMGEEYLYFNVSMEWGMHPHSRQYPQDYPISIQTASGFAHQYYVIEKTIIDKPDS